MGYDCSSENINVFKKFEVVDLMVLGVVYGLEWFGGVLGKEWFFWNVVE